MVETPRLQGEGSLVEVEVRRKGKDFLVAFKLIRTLTQTPRLVVK